MLLLLVAFLLATPQPVTAQAVAPQIIYGTFPIAPDRVLPTVKESVVAKFGSTSPMVAIASCESGFRQFDTKGSVLRGDKNPKDLGTFQINEAYHQKTAEKLGLDLKTLDGNLEYAKKLYESEGTKPWSASSHCWS